MFGEAVQSVVTWYMSHVNYATITLLMTIESSFIPFPSEVVIPPAAFRAQQGDLNIYLVVLFGTLGSMLGALFNYYFSLLLGRKVIYYLADTKLAHLLMINRTKIEQSEAYFVKYGNVSTLIGRLVPAIRQLISIPAGLAKMPMGSFLLYTFIGSVAWNIVLAVLGYIVGENQSLFTLYYKEISYGVVALVILGLGVILWRHKRKQKNA